MCQPLQLKEVQLIFNTIRLSFCFIFPIPVRAIFVLERKHTGYVNNDNLQNVTIIQKGPSAQPLPKQQCHSFTTLFLKKNISKSLKGQDLRVWPSLKAFN